MAMDAALRRECNNRCAINYYHQHKDEVQRKKLLKRMEQGYTPKPATLAKYCLNKNLATTSGDGGN